MSREWPPQNLSDEELARIAQRRERAADFAAFGPGLDPGIRRYVAILWAAGVETYQSCQGGDEPWPSSGATHAFAEPTVQFQGSYGAGWWAVQVCLDNGLPIKQLRRSWYIENGNEPTGPTWEITFREAGARVS